MSGTPQISVRKGEKVAIENNHESARKAIHARQTTSRACLTLVPHAVRSAQTIKAPNKTFPPSHNRNAAFAPGLSTHPATANGRCAAAQAINVQISNEP